MKNLTVDEIRNISARLRTPLEDYTREGDDGTTRGPSLEILDMIDSLNRAADALTHVADRLENQRRRNMEWDEMLRPFFS